MENIHLLFNKTMYESGERFGENIAREICKIANASFMEKDFTESPIAEQKFWLKTQYPGILMGSGYAHGISDENDAKIGFSFDYVTGQPYIPGSTIKGIIRSIFEKTENDDGEHYIIPEILKENGIILPDSSDEARLIKEITDNIFEGNDVFLDAVVRCGDKRGKVLGFDYITPHPNPVKNPKPIKFVKVLPDVIFEFRFILHDTVLNIDGEELTISAGKKKWIFNNILTEFGVGAKTNVGYGNMAKSDENEVKAHFTEAETAGQRATDYRSNFRQGSSGQSNKPKSQFGSLNNSGGKDGIKCPHCKAWNFRFKKDSNQETYNWKNNTCRICGQSLGLK